MNKGMKIIPSVLIVTMFTGCSLTGRLHKKEYAADIGHTTKQQREMIEKPVEENRQGYIQYTRADSTTVFLIPTAKGADGETMMQMNIDEVVVVAKSRTLPERLGMVNIDFVVTMPKELQGNCRSVEVTPVLHKATGEVALEDLTIRGALFNKVQQRNYWQYDTYRDRFRPDSAGERRAFERFVNYPYPEGVRLDSVVEHRETLKYYYTQQVKTDEAGGTLRVTLQGKVVALDRSYYALPISDTLEFNISSMLTFVDTTTRYVTRVIEKYVELKDRNYLNFPVNRSDIVDTLGNNMEELGRIEGLMHEIMNQKEFHVDSIILTSSASPEGSVRQNELLSGRRAASLKGRLIGRFPSSELDRLITVRSIGEDWQELERLVAADEGLANRDAILALVAGREGRNLDELEREIKQRYPAEYRYLLENIYPHLRAVSFKYDLRRVGMVKDTIVTTVPDTLYARGVSLLKERKYHDALEILHGFRDRNTAVCLLSLGHDDRALAVLERLPQSSSVQYLKAIACARLGREDDAMRFFDAAVELNETLKYRGGLDPELSTLIKRREDEKDN